LTLRLFVGSEGLQCLGRHLREMKVTVDPGSKSTFSMVRDRTVEMVSHTRILNGVSLFLLGLLDAVSGGLSPTSELAACTAKESAHTMKAHFYCEFSYALLCWVYW